MDKNSYTNGCYLNGTTARPRRMSLKHGVPSDYRRDYGEDRGLTLGKIEGDFLRSPIHRPGQSSG